MYDPLTYMQFIYPGTRMMNVFFSLLILCIHSTLPLVLILVL